MKATKPEDNPATPANLEQVEKQLEKLAGHKLDINAELIATLFRPIGAHNFADGEVKLASIFIPPTTSCNKETLLDASGLSLTGANGERVFLLSEVICLPPVRLLAEPINVLATVRSKSPFFATTTHTLVNNGTDVQVTVFTWQANGVAAPNIAFYWRCRVVSKPVIL